MELTGRLQVTSWQEDEIRGSAGSGGRTTRASIGYGVTGDVDGEAVSDVVMYYLPDGTASVVGLWQVTGSARGRSGSLVFEAVGGYDGTTAISELRSVPGSGTEDFAGVGGTGTTTATRENVEYTLSLEL
jgi:hypothetical protein